MFNYILLHLFLILPMVFDCLGQEIEAGRSINSEKWYYSKDGGSFEPSFRAGNPDPSLVGFYIGLNSDNQNALRICAPIGTAIWVDNQLLIGSTIERCLTTDLADWRSVSGKDSVFVLLHNQADLITESEIVLLASGDTIEQSSNALVPLKRKPNRKNEFILVFSIIFFAAMGYFRLQFPRIFRSFLDMNRVLSIRVRDEMVTGFRLFSLHSMTIHVLVSILSGFFLTVGNRYLNESLQVNEVVLLDYINEWGASTLMILAFLLGKRFLIQVFGEIFQMRNSVYLQVFEFLRSIFILFSTAFFVYLVFFYMFENAALWLIANMAGFAIAFIISAVLLMFYKLAFETRYQKLHLFSYLCATEILPAILLLKWMFF